MGLFSHFLRSLVCLVAEGTKKEKSENIGRVLLQESHTADAYFWHISSCVMLSLNGLLLLLGGAPLHSTLRGHRKYRELGSYCSHVVAYWLLGRIGPRSTQVFIYY